MNKKAFDINKKPFLTQINQGNVEAHGLLFKLYYDKLMHVAYSYLNNKEDSEELVQEVFVKLWEKRKSINIDTSINAYVYNMCRNLCIDHLRKKSRKLSIESSISQEESLINYRALSDDSSSAIMEKELWSQISLALEGLPDKCKQVFTKSRFEGLMNKEISEELDISIKTVENHMSKALKHMRLYLREYLPFL